MECKSPAFALLIRLLLRMEHPFGFESAAVLLYDEKSEELYLRAAIGYQQEIIKTFRTTIGGRGITSYVAKTKKPLYVPDVTKNPRYVPGIDNARSEIALPLLVENHLIGIVDLESQSEYLFTEDDIEVLSLFASHLALTINNALLFECERQQSSQLMVIHKIRQRISVNSEKYQQILELSVTDGLTGLFVHRFFQEMLDKEIERAIRHRESLLLIFFGC